MNYEVARPLSGGHTPHRGKEEGRKKKAEFRQGWRPLLGAILALSHQIHRSGN